MLRFYWRLVKRTPGILWDSARLWVEIAGVYTLVIGIIGVSTLTFPPIWALIPIVLFFLYGFMKANYEEFRAIERERDRLRDEKETDEKRAAIGQGLADLYHEGATLRAEIVDSTDETPASECDKRLLEWRRSVVDYIEENVSIGKAQYVDAVSSVKAVSRMGMKSDTTRQEKEIVMSHIEERLARLAEVAKEY